MYEQTSLMRWGRFLEWSEMWSRQTRTWEIRRDDFGTCFGEIGDHDASGIDESVEEIRAKK